MQTWYEGYPAEPLTVLSAVETILERECVPLLSHLRAHSFTPQLYAWPLLQTFFTEVLSKEDWMRFMDHLFTYRDDPELIVYFCAAFLICSKGALMQINTAEEMYNF